MADQVGAIADLDPIWRDDPRHPRCEGECVADDPVRVDPLLSCLGGSRPEGDVKDMPASTLPLLESLPGTRPFLINCPAIVAAVLPGERLLRCPCAAYVRHLQPSSSLIGFTDWVPVARRAVSTAVSTSLVRTLPRCGVSDRRRPSGQLRAYPLQPTTLQIQASTWAVPRSSMGIAKKMWVKLWDRRGIQLTAIGGRRMAPR